MNNSVNNFVDEVEYHPKTDNASDTLPDTTSEVIAVEMQAATRQIGKKLDTEFVDDLMRQLNEAEGSQVVPRWMEPREREALLERLTRQARSQKRLRRWSQVIHAIGMSVFAGFAIASLCGLIGYIPDITLPLILCYTLANICMNMAEKRWGRAAAKMSQFDDLRAIGPLLEALDLRDTAVVDAAETTLLRLLPRLQASDSNAISETQRECLYRRLKIQNAQTEAEFIIVALKALEQVGDAKALPCVEALTVSADRMPAAVRVREAAAHCLVFLKARAEQKEWSDNLLRAASASSASSDMLLRPVIDDPLADPQHLLRPGRPEN